MCVHGPFTNVLVVDVDKEVLVVVNKALNGMLAPANGSTGLALNEAEPLYAGLNAGTALYGFCPTFTITLLVWAGLHSECGLRDEDGRFSAKHWHNPPFSSVK